MSAPSTPPSEMPRPKDSRFKDTGTPCEWADSYRPGGFHPVHIQDVLRSRYRVIRKLGYGSFSTVWLAVDSISSIYVALKIHAANVDVSKELSIQQHLSANSNDSGSNFVLLLLDSFVLEGPNGKHHCFVTKAMGPSVSAVLQAPFEFYEPDNPPSHRFPTLRSRNFLRDTLTGLAFIHGNNIVHGDLQAGNLLFSLSDINTLNPQELEQNEANSNLEPLLRIDGKVDRWAPKYLVVPEPLVEEAMPQNEQTVTVADFGGAFWIDNPPESITTPLTFRAPETILHGKAGPEIDIWSFGCLMFALVTDYPLFELFTFRRQKDAIDDDHLIQLWETLGPLPKDMRVQWSRSSRYFGPDGERLATCPPSFDNSSDSGSPTPFPLLEDKFHEFKPDDINDAEAKEIVSLLRDILQIDPRKRPSASQLLKKPWFASNDLDTNADR